MRPSSIPIFIQTPGVVCALGSGVEDIREHLFSGQSVGMYANNTLFPCQSLMSGHVETPLPELLSCPLAQQTRNNRLLLAAFRQIEKNTRQAMSGIPHHRIATILGTSTSGVEESERAVRHYLSNNTFPESFHYSQQELGSPSRFLAEYLGVSGPTYTVATACTSSGKAMITGARLLAADMCDLAVVGGVDTLTRFTVGGFSALNAISAARCLPFSRHRSGTNIGEAATIFLLTKNAGRENGKEIRLAGWGESSDAYHISAPDPAGAGAKRAIEEALHRANCSPEDIGYINLHGTATIYNDAMESRVISSLFPRALVSSTKPLTGHTLAAAAALEAAFVWITLTDAQQRLPPHLWDNSPDPDNPSLHFANISTRSVSPLAFGLSVSFAFGGNNIALILQKT